MYVCKSMPQRVSHYSSVAVGLQNLVNYLVNFDFTQTLRVKHARADRVVDNTGVQIVSGKSEVLDIVS